MTNKSNSKRNQLEIQRSQIIHKKQKFQKKTKIQKSHRTLRNAMKTNNSHKKTNSPKKRVRHKRENPPLKTSNRCRNTKKRRSIRISLKNTETKRPSILPFSQTSQNDKTLPEFKLKFIKCEIKTHVYKIINAKIIK